MKGVRVEERKRSGGGGGRKEVVIINMPLIVSLKSCFKSNNGREGFIPGAKSLAET